MANRSSLFLLFLLFICPGPVSFGETAEGTTIFSLAAPRASSVALAGSFNQWDPSRHPLSGPDRNGTWTVTVPLAPGRYEYLFVINGSQWVADPAALTTDDGMGGRNSLIVIELK